MRSKIPAIVSALLALLLASQLRAETQSSVSTNAGLVAMTEGLKLREETAAAVTKGDLKPDAALARLKAHSSPFGLKGDPDAGFAFAAIDVGNRLIAAGKSVAAEPFFVEGEKSLISVLAKTPDSEAATKAMLLQNLSFVRANYLNKAAEANADIEAAIKLQPDNKSLLMFRKNSSGNKDASTTSKPAL